MKKLFLAFQVLAFCTFHAMEEGAGKHEDSGIPSSPKKTLQSSTDCSKDETPTTPLSPKSIGKEETKPSEKSSSAAVTTPLIDEKGDGKKEVGKTDKQETTKAQSVTVKFPIVCFSPGIQEIFITCINNEQKQLQGAWYRFTLQRVADSIVAGIKDRKISATLIVDESNLKEDFCYPLRCIINNNGKVYLKTKPRNTGNLGNFEIMHHKFMIFHKNMNGKKLVWTGSWNATGQATLKNCENAVILDDSESVEKFQQEFDTVLRYSVEVTADKCVSKKGKDKDPSLNFSRSMNDIPKPKDQK